MKKIFAKLNLLLIVIFLGLTLFVAPAQAAPFGLNLWGDSSDPNVGQSAFADFGDRDPRVIAGNIVQIFLGLLGVIAVVIIMYGGWLWMTAQGAPDKTQKAKDILRDAAIGLLIILSAFAITTFILSRLTEATGAQYADSCIAGETKECGCNGVRTCTDTGWGPCIGSDCGDNEANVVCDGNALTPTCDADDTICDANQFCDVVSACTCKARGNVGDACDSDPGTTGCQADTNCGQYLVCDLISCVCSGPPVIESFNPVDAAVGSLITISGRYFGAHSATSSHVYFWDGTGLNLEAQLAGTVNPLCGTTWFDREIVVVVPAGAQTGPIRVVAENGQDDTNDTRGPNLNAFVVNNVVRPGLCKLDPGFGKTDGLINYYGINLTGGQAHFGNVANNVLANTSTFSQALSGTATVPNIQAGATTTFVLTNNVASNFLRFVKTQDVANNLLISSFDPADGGVGQYVTIYGQGFGARKGDSKVYFGNQEASDDFPRACATSTWSDQQVVVKVPTLVAGNWQISMEVGPNSAVAPTEFVVNDVVRPGLCKIDPKLGQPNDELTLWGENFETQDTDSSVIFYQNNIVTGAEISFWGKETGGSGIKPDKVITRIHANALSGPVKVFNGLESNGLYLAVGSCTDNSQCVDKQVCCPAGTPEAGRCQASEEKCLGAFDASMFAWNFSTGFGKNNCPTGKPYLCGDGSCCATQCIFDNNLGITVCAAGASCSGLAADQCLVSNTCPNSPGSCSVNPSVTLTAGICNCQLLGCPDCSYNSKLNKCINVNGCNLDVMINDINGTPIEKFCADYQGTARWQVKTKQTCPPGFTKHAVNPGLCVDVTKTCKLCAGNLSCLNVGNVDLGRCGLNNFVCPNNFTCNANQQCEKQDGLCECCCDKKQNNKNKTNPACCAPLTCENECGAGGDFGYCSGCATAGTTQAEHDAACNCTGASGKYCDLSVPGGACRDCSQITSGQDCSSHAACCIDYARGSACRPVTGSKFYDALDKKIYCSYFSCDDCRIPDRIGDFTERKRCEQDCSLSCNSNPGGVCSIDDSICKKISANLECDVDTCICEPITVPENLCGCQLDSDCNNLVQGCGYDGCCYDRPLVKERIPAIDETNTCRNVMIRAKFDQLMSLGSFDENVLVVGDYGNTVCPDGTELLVREDRNLLLAMLARPVFAASNYCAVQGRVLSSSFANLVDSYSEVNFAPLQELDVNRKYYVIIRGDARLDSTSGATSDWQIGLKGTNYSDTYIFNGIVYEQTGVSYPNAEIWSFTTGADICQLDRVEIVPDQYLFQEPKQVYDSFLATAYSVNDQPIVPSANYNWTWTWSSDDETVATVEQQPEGDEAIVTGGIVDDERTFIRVKATIAKDTVNANSTVGQTKEGLALINLFFCQNPWPHIEDLTAWPFRWRDAVDNCDLYPDINDPSYCIDNHFEFHYCRDTGQKHTKDDLPAFITDAVVRARDDHAPSPLLKEFYFFREKLPIAPGITALENNLNPNGGGVKLTWSSVAGATYKVYYGLASNKYTDWLIVSAGNTLEINNLRNDSDYYFAVTAINNKAVESPYSTEKTIRVADIVAPGVPGNASATVDVTGASKLLDLNWQLDTADTYGYIIEYGPNQPPAARINVGLTNTYQILGVNNINVQQYYVNLRAFDAYDNLSDPVKFLCASGCANRCACTIL